MFHFCCAALASICHAVSIRRSSFCRQQLELETRILRNAISTKQRFLMDFYPKTRESCCRVNEYFVLLTFNLHDFKDEPVCWWHQNLEQMILNLQSRNSIFMPSSRTHFHLPLCFNWLFACSIFAYFCLFISNTFSNFAASVFVFLPILHSSSTEKAMSLEPWRKFY